MTDEPLGKDQPVSNRHLISENLLGFFVESAGVPINNIQILRVLGVTEFLSNERPHSGLDEG